MLRFILSGCCLPRCWSWGRHSAPRWPGRTRCGSWCPWLAPCAAGVILWAVVAHGLNLHFTLQVEVNGTVVGSVATEQNFDTARADLQARLAAARQLADSDTAALPVLEPTYTLHIGGTPMTELQLTDAILRASGSSIVEGTAVYLDGSLAFVTVEGDHLRNFFNQLQRPWRAP